MEPSAGSPPSSSTTAPSSFAPPAASVEKSNGDGSGSGIGSDDGSGGAENIFDNGVAKGGVHDVAEAEAGSFLDKGVADSSSGFSHRSLPKVKTLPAEVSNSETVEVNSGPG